MGWRWLPGDGGHTLKPHFSLIVERVKAEALVYLEAMARATAWERSGWRSGFLRYAARKKREQLRSK